MDIEQRIDDLLKQMSTEEKITFCAGASCMTTAVSERLGIHPLTMSDGPNGVRSDGQPGSENTTALPCGMALAASFDTELAEKYGKTIALDSKALGIGVSLGPGVNIMRTPLCGRNFEYYGEDPVLAGKIGSGYIRGCQKEKVAATPKHLALNNQEICRTTGSSDIDERTLRELYLTAFEIMTKEGKPWMMMSSYNRINGTYASENGFTQELVVKREWGFDGVMVSDWGGTHDTCGAMLGGLDLEMGGPGTHFTVEKVLPLVKNGMIPESVLDDKVRRILRLLCRTGAIDGTVPEGVCGGDFQIATAKEAAEKSAVLLKNADSFLPVDLKKIKKIVVSGPNADFRHHRGTLLYQGGSGAVFSEREITPLAGLQKMAEDNGINLQYLPTYKFAHDRSCPEGFFGENGILCTCYSDQEAMLKNRDIIYQEKNFSGLFDFFTFSSGEVADSGNHVKKHLPQTGFAARFSATITVPDTAGKEAVIKLTTTQGECKVTIGGQDIPGNNGTFFYNCDGGRKELPLEVELLTGRLIRPFFRIDWYDPEEEKRKRENFLAAVKEADMVIFCGGRTKVEDKEAIGWGDVANADVKDLALPGDQDELIANAAKLNPNILVTLNSGSAMDVEKWIGSVAGLLQLWYPGEAGGSVLCDIICGKVNPSGRLPFTWAKDLMDYPCHANGNYPGNRTGADPHVRYDEGIFVGYRHFDKVGSAVRYPVGYGLGYAKFSMEISGFEFTGKTVSDAACKISVKVKNIPETAGIETVQIYTGAVEPEFDRPVKELKKFAKVRLLPEETKEIGFELSWRDFAAFHPAKHHWCVPEGNYRVILAANAATEIDSRQITINA